MKCPYCGAELLKNAKFCADCGKSVITTEPFSETDSGETKWFSTEELNAVIQDTEEAPTPEVTLQKFSLKHPKRWQIFAVVAIAVSVFICCIIVWQNNEATIDGSVVIDPLQVDMGRYPEIEIFCDMSAYFSKSNQSYVYDGSIPLSAITMLEKNGKDASAVYVDVTAMKRRPAAYFSIVADLSEEMSQGGKLAQEQTLINAFIDQWKLQDKGQDQIELWGFHYKTQQLLAPTDNRNALNDAINAMQPAGGAVLYDGIYAALQSAAQITGGYMRYVIVFADSNDENSRKSLQEVIAYAQYYHIPVGIIRMGDYADPEMEMLAQATGGFYTLASSMTDISTICYNKVLDIDDIYAIKYTTKTDLEKLQLSDIGIRASFGVATGLVKNMVNFSGSTDWPLRPNTAPKDEPVADALSNGTADSEIGSDSLLGNTASNILNGGYVAQKDGWLYYRNTADHNSLYKSMWDGSEKRRLSTDEAYSINVVGDWLYYSNENDHDAIYKIRIDGSERTKLCDDVSWYLNVTAEHIYYRCKNDSNHIYRIKTDGTQRVRLNDDDSHALSVRDGWIYYRNQLSADKQDWRIYKMRTDGTERQKVCDSAVGAVSVFGEWLYFRNYDDHDRLYRIKTDGSNMQKVLNSPCYYFNCTDDWIYYSNGDDNRALYKSRISGKEQQELATQSASYINLVGNQLYFEGSNDHKLYNVHVNGGEPMLVD